MLRPVGSLPASVYWRRRAVLLAAIGLLIALSAWVLRPGHPGHPLAANTTPSTSAANAALTSAPPLSTRTNVPHSTAASTTSGRASRPASSSSAPPQPCAPTQLAVSAVASQASYQVGAKPNLMLQVINLGPHPCVQDLADSQVELRVYNGESRIWGSHDCEIQPGVDDQTLAVGQPVRVSILWSGLSSQPNCAGVRQQVGAGTYTLYPLLSGHAGKVAQFSIT